MNTYPSWIHRIPEMIEALALADRERIYRHTVERLFDLRKTATFHLLRAWAPNPSAILSPSAAPLLMARLLEAQEHPQWRWERESRDRIRERIDSLRATGRKSLVPMDAALRQAMETAEIAGLPATIRLSPGLLAIHCSDMEDLLRQLVLLAQAVDRNHEPSVCRSKCRSDAFQRARLAPCGRKIQPDPRDRQSTLLCNVLKTHSSRHDPGETLPRTVSPFSVLPEFAHLIAGATS
jgi:hypothetical protein